MFGLDPTNRFMLYSRPCDMRKSFDGLCGMITQHMAHNPQSGTVYIFLNRSRDRMKLLRWMPGGFVLYYKRLERGTFEFPGSGIRHGSVRLSYAQLVLLVDGLSVQLSKKRPRFSSTLSGVKQGHKNH